MKRLLSMLLVLVLSVGIFAGCQKAPEQPAVQDNPEETLPPVEDDGVMKILLIGHSLGVDSVFMFPDICKSEGVENMVVGFLYHSGCQVAQHVKYARANAAQYAYYEYDTATQDEWLRADCNGNFTPCQAGAANDIYIEDGSIAQTLQFGIQRHDWDMVVLQAGASESANRLHASSYYKNEPGKTLPDSIQELMDYVLATDVEPGSVPKFAWNMVWSSPKDPAVRSDSTNTMLLTEYENSEYNYYLAMSDTLKNVVEPAFDFEYVFPNGTTIQNIKSTKLANAEIYRDYGHVTDFGRLAAAYTWYCTLFDKDITACKLAPMNYKVVLDQAARLTKTDLVLSDEYRAILIEAVGNALANPYQMTQSQY